MFPTAQFKVTTVAVVRGRVVYQPQNPKRIRKVLGKRVHVEQTQAQRSCPEEAPANKFKLFNVLLHSGPKLGSQFRVRPLILAVVCGSAVVVVVVVVVALGTCGFRKEIESLVPVGLFLGDVLAHALVSPIRTRLADANGVLGSLGQIEHGPSFSQDGVAKLGRYSVIDKVEKANRGTGQMDCLADLWERK
jgi:hypothetical protein